MNNTQKHINEQEFQAIRTVGGLLSTQVLREARKCTLPGQTPADYTIPKGLRFNDELGRYWRIAQALWRNYQKQLEREDIDTNTLAIDDWLIPLLTDALGYSISKTKPIFIGEREFPITHTANEQSFPLLLCGSDYELDKGHRRFGQEGNKRSPLGLVQEYLNAEDNCLWAIISNGKTMRLLRDNPAMTRPAYIEINFEQLFNENNHADFATIWLLLHHTRVKPQEKNVEECWLEQWREKGQKEGERILGQLRFGVADALRSLGTGFLAHENNQPLREKISTGELSKDDYFQQILKLVYRLLFLLASEDRDVALYPEKHHDENYREARKLYQRGYSISLLRKRSRLRSSHDHHRDAWQQLLITFTGFEQGQPLLAQPALGGLFNQQQCIDLISCDIQNSNLYKAIFELSFFETNSIMSPVNYRDMDTEEFGSVYESLLELVPQIHTEGTWSFSFLGDQVNEKKSGGHARKLSGSYYTPDSLVQELIKSALVPVINDRLEQNKPNPKQAILSIKVCDPACGSGHFLLAAARKLATELAKINAKDDQATEDDYRHALREVVRHCIYGVDINPLAIELCKTGLWLESIESGKPLNFLDAHIQCGNALVGLMTPDLLEKGIPSVAYKALTGDNKTIATALRNRNKLDKNQTQLLASHTVEPIICASGVDELPEDDLQQIEHKRVRWLELMQGEACKHEKLRADLFASAFFAPKTQDNAEWVPTNIDLATLEAGDSIPVTMKRMIDELAESHRFFHWYLAFPEVFKKQESSWGGFDVMLGNPPWERIKLQEKEFFAVRSPLIAEAKNKAERTQRLKWLSRGRLQIELDNTESYHKAESDNEQQTYKTFVHARHSAESQSAFARLSGRYPLTGKGDVNLYALFAEHFAKAITGKGRSGVIVPTGIATDDSTKFYFGWLANNQRLASLYDFENREALFPGVHRSYKFCLLTMGQNIPQAELAFFLAQTHQLQDERRKFSLSAEDFNLINPNTKTCPVFRSQMDAELTKKIYRKAPILINETLEDETEGNPWGIRFQAMFHMSADSHLFHTYKQLSDKDFQLEGATFVKQDNKYLPLYEAKMIHHYDHRWATFETDGKTSRNCKLEEKQDTNYNNLPRYWVDEWEVTLRTAQAPKMVLDAAKKQDNTKLNFALLTWVTGTTLLENDKQKETSNKGKLNDLLASPQGVSIVDAKKMAKQWPMSASEYKQVTKLLTTENNAWQITKKLLEGRRPKYLLGWRDICRATDERTVISSATPLAAVGNKYPLIQFQKNNKPREILALIGNLSVIPFDFVARQKIGGITLNYFYLKQFPVLSPDQYTKTDQDFIVPRILELTYTNQVLKAFAKDLGYSGEPFPFDLTRRQQLKCELDAYYAKLYDLDRDELRYILDPTDVMGEDYPSETFRVLKNKEINKFGEYRTQRLVLEAWDKLEAGELQ